MATSTFHVVIFLLCAFTGSKSQQKDLSKEDPCEFYSTYTDTWRNPREEAPPVHCDRIRHINWYAFMLGLTRAYIPTATCLQDNTCGGQAAYYVNLEGVAEMPKPGETINATLCTSARVLDTMACCAFRHEIQIKHCINHDAFIYYLPVLNLCPVTICAIPVQQKELDERYTFKPGQIPRSLQTTTTTSPPTSPPDTSTAELTTMSSWNTTDVTSQETTANQQKQVAALSCFTEYQPLLIAAIVAIVILVICTLVFVCMRLYRHYRKQGTWRAPPDQKGDEEAAEGLGSKTLDAVNGNHQHHGVPGDGTAEVQGADGEDNWWVVPLDQAPEEAAVGKGQNNEDTRM